MEFEPISATRMIALMIAGAVFACVGLYMMVRPRPEGAAKVELFGLKFESSSVGLLVFIVGAAFLSVTLFVPERASAPVPGASQAAVVADQKNTNTAVVLPSDANAAEVEPNDRVQEANQIALGATVSGRATNENLDWYVLDTSGLEGQGLEVKVRIVAGDGFFLELFDDNEERKERQLHQGAGATVAKLNVVGARVFIRIKPAYTSHPVKYELETRAVDF